ncbi:hypothetical protein GCM10023196_099530 [Actinoallomurus vinaceus]|uniref:Uncharacterized protein n=1 Tax=Actinoallomurus vinaceus TaxID=1080074 RepID=A0ABP8UUU7_9ACTN
MTNHTLPRETDAASNQAGADLDALFITDVTLVHQHAENHAGYGVPANDETVYAPGLDALFTGDAAPAYGHGNSHATFGLSANDETVYDSVS